MLELESISKSFGAIQALQDVDLTVSVGEAVGLMGDNGAGKSTLMKIVAGNYPPTAGSIRIEGPDVHFHKPIDAREHGIEIVYQLVQVAIIDRKRRVGVGARPGVGGKMLCRNGHARSIGSGGKPGGQGAHRCRVGMQRAVAYDLRQPQIQVNHRCETQIDTQRAQLRCHEPTEGTGGGQRLLRITVVQAPKRTHGRQFRKRTSEPLHSTAFVVHRHQQGRIAGRVNLGNQFAELNEIPKVPGEEDHAPDRGGLQPRPLFGVHPGSLEIDHQGAEWRIAIFAIHAIRETGYSSRSTTVPGETMSKSSMTSSSLMRMQPMEAGVPRAYRSGVPWR